MHQISVPRRALSRPRHTPAREHLVFILSVFTCTLTPHVNDPHNWQTWFSISFCVICTGVGQGERERRGREEREKGREEKKEKEEEEEEEQEEEEERAPRISMQSSAFLDLV